jgi:hypothetical protein
MSKEVNVMGFSKLSVRPRHYAQNEGAEAAFENVCPGPGSASAFALMV